MKIFLAEFFPAPYEYDERCIVLAGDEEDAKTLVAETYYGVKFVPHPPKKYGQCYLREVAFGRGIICAGYEPR